MWRISILLFFPSNLLFVWIGKTKFEWKIRLARPPFLNGHTPGGIYRLNGLVIFFSPTTTLVRIGKTERHASLIRCFLCNYCLVKGGWPLQGLDINNKVIITDRKNHDSPLAHWACCTSAKKKGKYTKTEVPKACYWHVSTMMHI